MNRDFIDTVSRTLGRSTSRRQTFKLLGGGIAASFVTASGLRRAAAQSNPFLIPIEGTLDGKTFEGFLEVTDFVNQAGDLVAVGNILNAAGNVIGAFSALVTTQQASCQILRLELGPLELDLLGLVITIPNPIIIEIEAVPGAGNLLGNLLCAIARLLDTNASTNAIARLLNRLLRLLG